METGLIETGQLVNTHGINGRLKLQPWADSPGFLSGIEYIYIDEKPVRILSAEIHKNSVLVSLEGIDSLDKAIKLKGKVISVKRNDIEPGKGKYFIADLINLQAIDYNTGARLGTVTDIMTLPAHNVYVINGEREILVPANDEFIKETDITKGFVKINLIEGL